MASIIKKKIKNQIYYYYAESKRIDGKPRLVNQKYLGTAEKLLELQLLSKKPIAEQVLHSNESEFGSVMLIYDIASRLGIADIVDGILPKRKQGASIGTHILTAAINRVADPTSKNGLAEWYASTCLPVATGLKPSAFSPQNFWNNTCVSGEEVDLIEDAILRKVVDTYDIDTSHIIYDATNFFTYIDTMQGSELAKRGHNKEKRNGLRIVGLSLMVSPDFAIPLLHETYPGNRPDSKEFHVMMGKLKARYGAITKSKADVTVVFDRGNNAEDNIELLESGEIKLHYIGGLKKNQAKEFFSIPHSKYTPLNSPSLEGQLACRREMEVFGRNVTVLIVYNPELEKGQMQGILINIWRTEEKLAALQQRLIRRANGELKGGKKPTAESVACAAGKILAPEYMNDIFICEISEKNGYIHLDYECSEEQLVQISVEWLGKTVLFTDRKDFTNEQIVAAYRSAWHVESAFKQMKNPKHLAVRPIFHWTDDKIRVHIFICVLALRLCSLLIKELSQKGIQITINRLIDDMSGLKRISTFFGDINKPKIVESFTLGSDLAKQIEGIYQLKAKYS